jgi:hypothetical protein
VGLLTASVGSAQAITIAFDNFTTNFATGGGGPITASGASGSNPLTATGSGLPYNLSNGLGVITRDATVRRTAGGTQTTFDLNPFIAEVVRLDNGTSARSTATIRYNFGNTTSDLTSSGSNNGLRLTYAANKDFSITIRARDSLSNLVTFSGTLPTADTLDPITEKPLTNFDVHFSSFTGSGGFSFGSVSSVEYEFSSALTDADADFSFIAATAVPEPLTILGTLLAGGIGVAMKKKKSSEIQE